jgi:PAS domain S-box-containing protein
VNTCIHWFEMAFGALPFAFLEVWGRFAFIVGCFLAVAAFGGFTFRLGNGWGLGRERQAWDAKAILSIPITFILILATGYIGSFIVLVPGAQTFESLKDLTVFLCIVLFGYPALITVPFAYGLSDLIEGVPPDFLRDWLLGYFINPACFWVAYQLIGKNPDFRLARTWRRYLAFVMVFLGLEPILWGYICAGKFTPAISYRNIASALFFTTSITWLLAPIAMLGALPLARKSGMFWAEIAGHVRERRWRRKELIWEAGTGGSRPETGSLTEHVPIRMLFLVPFIMLVLTMVGTTAYVTLHSAEKGATKLAMRLHEEISQNIMLQLDEYLEKSPPGTDIVPGIALLFKDLRVSRIGIALLLDRSGKVLASSAPAGDPLAAKVIANFDGPDGKADWLQADAQFRFDIISDKPVDRETWLAQATAYKDRRSGRSDWVVVTAMPESYYLSGVEAGNSRAAMVFALALMLSLAVTAILAEMVTGGLRRLSMATQGLARGDLSQRLIGSRLEEMNRLALTFNDMADRLARSIDALLAEVALRGKRELELQASEAKMRTSESRFRALFENGLDGFLLTTTDGQILAANPAACRMFGRSEAEIVHGGRASLVAAGDPRFPALIGQSERTGRLQGELTMRRGDETRFEAEIASANYASEEGPRTSMVIRDITERKRADDALRRSEEKFSKVFMSAPAGIVLSTLKDGVLREINEEYARIFGHNREDMLGRTSFDLGIWQKPEDRGEMTRLLQADGSFRDHNLKMKRKDGSSLDIRFSAQIMDFDGVAHLVGAFIDVTDQRRAEEDLAKSNERFALATHAAHMGVWDWDIPADLLVWDGRMYELYGIPRESFTGAYGGWSGCLHPDDRERVSAEIQQALRGERPFQSEFRISRPDGSLRHIGAVAEVSRHADGEPLRMTGINFDITERMRAEEAQIRLVAIVNASDDAIISKTLDGLISTWNSGAEKMFGYTAEEAIGQSILMIFPPERFEEEKGILSQIRAGRVVKNFETVRVCKNGKKLNISETLSPIFDGNGKIVGGSNIARDISERKRMEEQLNRTQRLESIGNLASGIAHDLNNVLLPIQLSLELLEMKISDPYAQRLLATMRTSAKRGADIVQQVLTFGRGDEGERRLIEPKQVIDEVMRIIRETFTKSIRIRAEVPEGLSTFMADTTQVHQIFLNLCVNARDAMPQGGTLTISAENVEIGEPDTRLHPEARIGPYVLIKVTDTGAGIPPEIRDKVFEPFFTTKEVGKGTGLGLSTVHSMVKRHGGFLNLYSEVGKGTSFHLYFPAENRPPEEQSGLLGEMAARHGPQGKGELVLLVDDEAEIRDTTTLILETNGYRVLCANDGLEAIARYAERQGEIAVVITDIMMPNLDGEAAIRELLKADPLARIIAVSGLVENTRAALRNAGGSVLCLSKPYGAVTILEAVRKIIDEPGIR